MALLNTFHFFYIGKILLEIVSPEFLFECKFKYTGRRKTTPACVYIVPICTRYIEKLLKNCNLHRKYTPFRLLFNLRFT